MVRSNQKRSERVVMKRFLSFTVFSLASLAMVFAVGAAELKIVSSGSSRARIVSPSAESATTTSDYLLLCDVVANWISCCFSL